MKNTLRQQSRSHRVVANNQPKVSFSSSLISQYLIENNHDDNDENTIEFREVSYRSKGLTADDVQSIATFFTSAIELDLSENIIDCVPHGLPGNILALNLSKNKFHSLIGFDQLRYLRMLKLFGNNIDRTWGLQACTQLEYLDLSNNNIAIIEGFETLTKLNTLILSNNKIRKMGSLRPLSFNISLQELNLLGNEVTTYPNYNGALKHLISSLKYLDGEPLYFKDGNRGSGYSVRYDCRKNLEQSSFHEAIRSIEQRTHSEWNDISVRWDELDRPMKARSLSSKKVQPSCRNGGPNESVVSASSSCLPTLEDEEMMLPWRRAPYPIPKDLKGNDMYEAPPSPPPSPKKPVEKPKKNQRKIDYHLYSRETQSSTSKKEHKVNVVSPNGYAFATNIKGGSFDRSTHTSSNGAHSPEVGSAQKFRAQKGSMSNSARAANIKYPVYQPNFSPPEPPPPPPPPKNKYKVTLGTKPGMAQSSKKVQDPHLIRKDSHSPKNDIFRVQALGEYDDKSPYLNLYPNSPQNKKNIIENKNRPVLVRSNSGGLTRMDGLPILADDDLREAVSPKKPLRPLHSSLSVEEYDRNTDNDETRKIITEYRNRGGLSAATLTPVSRQWVLPPLPSEISEESDFFGEESSFSASQESSYYSDEQSQRTFANEELIQNALHLFCEQKRNTIQNIKAKKAQSQDPLMF